MNKTVLPCLIAIGIVVSGSALAAPVSNGGIIHFTGTVVEEPCVITQDTADQMIGLGSVASGELAAKGDTSAQVPFSIILEKCDTSTISTASFAFTGVASPDDATALLNNGDADKVGVQIIDASGSVVPLDASPSNFTLTLASGTQNVADFTAHMIATGTGATAGTVDAQTTFTVAYN